jgi:hypothetical protein
MLTDTEKIKLAFKKLPSPAPKPEVWKKYKPCTCGSSYWLIDYYQREKLICGDCQKVFEKGEIYTDA